MASPVQELVWGVSDKPIETATTLAAVPCLPETQRLLDGDLVERVHDI